MRKRKAMQERAISPYFINNTHKLQQQIVLIQHTTTTICNKRRAKDNKTQKTGIISITIHEM